MKPLFSLPHPCVSPHFSFSSERIIKEKFNIHVFLVDMSPLLLVRKEFFSSSTGCVGVKGVGVIFYLALWQKIVNIFKWVFFFFLHFTMFALLILSFFPFSIFLFASISDLVTVRFKPLSQWCWKVLTSFHFLEFHQRNNHQIFRMNTWSDQE